MGSTSLGPSTPTARLVGLPHSRLMVLLFSDIVGSTDLKNQLGTVEYANLLSQHDRIFRDIISSTTGASILKDIGDGFFASFATASDAVRAALRFQYELHRQAKPLKARIGLHVGEVVELELEQNGQPKFVGLAADFAARLMSLATGGQILMTRVTFNDARQFVRSHPAVQENGQPPEIRWIAHGQYLFKGADEPVEVFEVGAVGIAPLGPPPDSEKAHRNVRPGDEVTLGWRPAGGLELRGRPNWIIRQKLGEGGFGEVWLAEHEKTGTRRVFKFCFEPQRLRGLKREVVLFRLLKEALGARQDIARIVDFQFDENPYFIETEYFPDGTLHDWARAQGGLKQIPLAQRIEIVARVAEALAAAHSVGVLHKDLKPSNILMRIDGEKVEPVITDFGIGILTDRALLEKHDITMVGFTQSALTENESSRTGTRLYSPPESMLNQPFTVQGDVYALGVLLYQMVVGDLNRPLAIGWERDVSDDLQAEDIAACVEGNAQRRLSSAAELASRLDQLDERRKARASERNAARATARRQRMLVGMAILLVVAIGLAGGLWATLRERTRRLVAERERAAAEIQARSDAEAARDRISQESKKSTEVTEFLRDMLTSADPARTNNPDMKVREVLDRAARRVDAAKHQPQVESIIRAALGKTYLNLGLYPQAERHLSSAVDLARQTAGMDNRETLKAFSDLGVLYLYTARYEQAQRIFSEALRRREKLLGPEHEDIADSLFHLSLVYGIQRRYDECMELGRRALTLREKRFGPESEQVAQSLQYLAQYTNEAGKFAEAEPHYLRSLQLREKLLGPNHFEVGISHNNIGLVYMNTGRLDLAEEHFAKAVSILTRSLGEAHPNVAMARTNLANIYMRREQYAKARPLIEQSLRHMEASKGLEHPDLIFPLYNLATAHYGEKNYPAAEASYKRAMALAEKAQGKDGPMALAVRVALAMMYHDNRDTERAEPLMRQVLPQLAAAGRVADALQVELRLLQAQVWRKQFDEVEPQALELYQRARQLADPQQRQLGVKNSLELLVELYRDWEKPEEMQRYTNELASLAPPATAPSPTTVPAESVPATVPTSAP